MHNRGDAIIDNTVTLETTSDSTNGKNEPTWSVDHPVVESNTKVKEDNNEDAYSELEERVIHDVDDKEASDGSKNRFLHRCGL